MEEKHINIGSEPESTNENSSENIIENVSEDVELPPNSDKPVHHHHHHRHGHHKHHRSSSSSKKQNSKKQEKIKAFFKTNKKKLINILVAIALVICLILIAVIMDNNGDSEVTISDATSNVSDEPIINALQIEIPLFSEDAIIAGAGVLKYMDSDITLGCDTIYNDLRKQYGRLDISMPVPISYKILGMPSDCTVEKTVVSVADNEDFENACVYELASGENTAYADFLCANKTYFFKISVTLSNNTTTGVQGSFKTADTPSFLNVDGVYNMRDIGGWKTEDGKTVKRGLLYRGSEIDGAVEDYYTVTQEGIRKMLKVLGVRFDMDLRASNVNLAGTDILGKSVVHKYYSETGATEYSNIFSSDITVKNAVRDIFKDLATPANYPIYVHCTYGTDRTGTICYVLGALLGMSEEDLMRDYQLSALHHGNVNEAIFTFVDDFKALEGNTMQEKAEGYLLSIGVTKEEIESVKAILVE